MSFKSRIFIYLFLSTSLISCGVDKLKKQKINGQYNISANHECSFTTVGPPVCGNDGKDYFNELHAQCFTSVKSTGHCQCNDAVTVCGKDGNDYPECVAVNSKIEIVKYIPCAASEY